MRDDEAKRIWQAVLLQAFHDIRGLYSLKKRGKDKEPKGWWQIEAKHNGEDALRFFFSPYCRTDLHEVCTAAGFCPRQTMVIAALIMQGDKDVLRRFTLRGSISLKKLRQLRRTIEATKIKQKGA